MKLTSSRSRDVTCVKAMNHGDSGIGKTTSLRTLPDDKTLIASAERGLLPLRHHDYPVFKIGSWDDVRELVSSMQQPEKFVEKLRAGGVANDTFSEMKILAIDSLSELSELCKKQIVTQDRRALMLERSRGERDTPSKVYDDLMVQEDWGLYRSRMMSMISAIVHLPVHVIFTCLSQWFEDRRTGQLFRTPNLNGKLALEVPAYFDLVLHMEEAANPEGEQTRVFRTRYSDNILAKDSSGALDPFEPPDWSHVFGKILNTNGGAQ